MGFGRDPIDGHLGVISAGKEELRRPLCRLRRHEDGVLGVEADLDPPWAVLTSDRLMYTVLIYLGTMYHGPEPDPDAPEVICPFSFDC
jgi:hypothetical protein